VVPGFYMLYVWADAFNNPAAFVAADEREGDWEVALEFLLGLESKKGEGDSGHRLFWNRCDRRLWLPCGLGFHLLGGSDLLLHLGVRSLSPCWDRLAFLLFLFLPWCIGKGFVRLRVAYRKENEAKEM
jgi:hypothetical protein